MYLSQSTEDSRPQERLQTPTEDSRPQERLQTPIESRNRLRKDTPLVMPVPKLTFSMDEAIAESENESDSELADKFPTFEPSFTPLEPRSHAFKVREEGVSLSPPPPKKKLIYKMTHPFS